jgi:hypothetical protein
LPLGTVIWSNPGTAGAQVERLVPAVPSPTGVADVFAFQSDGSVQAITSEGATAWTAGLNWDDFAAPDFQGGLIVHRWGDAQSRSIRKIDGMTGQSYPAYSPASSTTTIGFFGVDTDGTVIATQRAIGEPGHTQTSLVGIDPLTGTVKFTANLPVRDTLEQDLIIAGDGYAYVPYTYVAERAGDQTNRLGVFRVNSTGVYDNILVQEWRTPITDELAIPVHLITNADTGVLLSWSNQAGRRMAITTGTAVTVLDGPQLPGEKRPIVPVLQAEDGSFVGTVAAGGDETVTHMVAFEATGAVRWTVAANWQAELVTRNGENFAIADDGMVTSFDRSGNATGRLNKLPIYSWKNAYRVGSTSSIVPAFDLALIAGGYAAVPKGNLAGNGFSLKHKTFGLVFCGTGVGGDGPCSSTPDVSFSYIAGVNDENYSLSGGNYAGIYPEWVFLVT